MTHEEEADLFRAVAETVRRLVEPGSPADKDAEWLALWVCELKRLGVIDTPAGSLPLPADGE